MSNSIIDQARESGRVIAEGKTKVIISLEGIHDSVWIVSKDDITAGDGAKHDVLLGKAFFSTTTTCNVFKLLRSNGVPVAFTLQVNEVSFAAPLCKMLPYEVVVRGEAHGSFLKRRPEVRKGEKFEPLLVEFFLKTSGRKWKNHSLLCDDPLMVRENSEILLYEPGKPIEGQVPFLVLPEQEIFSLEREHELFSKMAEIATKTFLILRKAWSGKGMNLVDFKVEFGTTKSGKLLLADVIDNDSWRLLDDGRHLDKQTYREGGALDVVMEGYRRVAEMTNSFTS